MLWQCSSIDSSLRVCQLSNVGENFGKHGKSTQRFLEIVKFLAIFLAIKDSSPILVLFFG